MIYAKTARSIGRSARMNNAFDKMRPSRDVSKRNYEPTVSTACNRGIHYECFVLRCVCTCHGSHHAGRKDAK